MNKILFFLYDNVHGNSIDDYFPFNTKPLCICFLLNSHIDHFIQCWKFNKNLSDRASIENFYFVCNLTTFKFFMSKFFEKCEGVVWTSDSIVSWNRFKSTLYVKNKSRIKFDELIICLAVQADN
jgi:hypothetical protein